MNEHFDDILYEHNNFDSNIVIVTYDKKNNNMVASTRMYMGSKDKIYPFYWKKTGNRFRLYLSLSNINQNKLDKALELFINKGLWIYVDIDAFIVLTNGRNDFYWTQKNGISIEKHDAFQIFNLDLYPKGIFNNLNFEEKEFIFNKSKEINKNVLASLSGYLGYAKYIFIPNTLFEKCVKEYNIKENENLLFSNMFYKLVDIYKKTLYSSKYYAIKTANGKEINEIFLGFGNIPNDIDEAILNSSICMKTFLCFDDAQKWINDTTLEDDLQFENKLREKKKQEEEGRWSYYFKNLKNNYISDTYSALKSCRQNAAQYCKNNPETKIIIYKQNKKENIPYLEYVGFNNGKVQRKRLDKE